MNHPAAKASTPGKKSFSKNLKDKDSTLLRLKRKLDIEQAAERVRAKTLRMKHSAALAAVSVSWVQQAEKLGLIPSSAIVFFSLFDSISKTAEIWVPQKDCTSVPGNHPIPLDANKPLEKVYQSWRRQKKLIVRDLVGKPLAAYLKFLSSFPDARQPGKFKKLVASRPKRLVVSEVSFRQGTVGIISKEALAKETLDEVGKLVTVFEQTFARFLDLKKAEVLEREAQIEAALECVRAKTMGMVRSGDLAAVASVLFDQLRILGSHLWTCGLVLCDAEKMEAQQWLSAPGHGMQPPLSIPPNLSPYLRHMFDAWKNGEELFVEVAQGISLKRHYDRLKTLPALNAIYKKMPRSGFSTWQKNHAAIFKHGYLLIVTTEPYVDTNLFVRFAKVFEQTYTRFLDLQKAEAQAREAEIELALERVRAASMAMHSSHELSDVVSTLYQQMESLGFAKFGCELILCNKKTSLLEYWHTNPVQSEFPECYCVSPKVHNFFKKVWRAWEQQTPELIIEMRDREKRKMDIALLEKTDFKRIDKKTKRYILQENVAFFAHSTMKYGLLEAIDSVPLSEAQLSILHRFAKVFEQTYTRFLDLQKAEAQAREAQIEAALERVRSRTMAMHKSEELAETAAVLFHQMTELGVTPDRLNICLIKEDTNVLEVWSTDQEGSKINHHFDASLDEPTTGQPVYEAWKEKKKSLTIDLSGQELNDWIRYVRETMGMTIKEELVQEHRIHSMAFFSHGMVLTTTHQPLPTESMRLLERFADVFNLTYTRFLDLQKAEAQTREAQIEAALERVRGKAMAMHSSEDLTTTMKTFYHELELFSITPRRCGIGLIDKETRIAELSTVNSTEAGQSIDVIGRLKMTGHLVLEGIFTNWLSQKEYHPVLRGNEIKEYNQLIRPQIPIPESANDAIQYGYFFYFDEGGVYAWTEKELTEDELKIYRRFTTVLSLTYKRYKDLKDAEAREKEAIKQAALDRVRADIASMRSTADLDRITPLIWKELTTLGIPFIRCGVFIMDEKENKVHSYLSTPDGKAIAAFHTPMDDSGSLAGAIDSWKQQKVFVTKWVETDFQIQATLLLEQGSITSREQYLNTIPKEGFHLHFLPFRQGMLYAGSNDQLQSDVLRLVQSLAEAFSVAYARYEDFNKLESAKEQIEKTLSDLKQTQTQLIQSEKMASLGELTAGIAHEIQNPLNFVNNFSEVSTELVEELKAERSKVESERDKDLEEELLTDIFKNLEKINHHGKRAGDIVKGMLQHSRSSSGIKEPTDINTLVDEYLRLAYHGLRAKDKSFNAIMKTEFDETVGNINIIPQDIGRVILNLITNAFYVVNEKSKQNIVGYEPTVIVSTHRSFFSGEGRGEVIIKVKDNGNGIPDSIKEKIFQPFFTTKPTGQGTGLGLSLSYDIVKAHGGELRVETKEKEGATFILSLTINNS